MKTKKLTENITMVFSGDELSSNAYILESNGKKILIDAGAGNYKLDFIPDLCILTHAHYDHTKGVKPEWKHVLAHPAEIEFCKSAPAGLSKLFHMPAQAKPLAMGKQEIFGFEIEFFHTPGHTPGSICILDKKSGILFSGDTVFAGGYFGRTDIGGDEAEIYKSLQEIRKIEYKLLASGHGETEPKPKHHSDRGM